MRAPLVALAILIAALGAQAQVPALLSYQGKLLDDLGVPVPDGGYAMEFGFYDACSGGSLLLTDTHAAVQTKNGIYSVLLGSGTITAGVEPDLLAVFGYHDMVCLGVSVDGGSEMTPRQQIVSSGYAMRAALADAASPFSTVVHSDEDVTWTGVQTFDTTVIQSDGRSLAWPHVTGSPPPNSSFRITKFNANPAGQSLHPNGENDEQWMICYNCQEGSTFREDSSQHSWNQKIEASYYDGAVESLEYNWNYTNPIGTKWRPFAFRLYIDGQCSHDASSCVDDSECGAGNTCDGANRAEFQWNSRPDNSGADVELVRATGHLRYHSGLEGFIDHLGTTAGSGSLIGYQLVSNIMTENTSSGPVVYGISVKNDFSSATSDAQVSDLLGIRAENTFSGAAPGRDILGQMIAVDARNAINQTGAGPAEADRVFGFRYTFDPSGQNVTVTESNGARLETPVALDGGSPITVERHFGLRILDQRGLGTVDGDALVINAQSLSPSSVRGNLTFKGGGWNDGHLRLEDGHLWMDKTNETLRFKSGTPSGETDGFPVHSPAGTSISWGGVYWGDSGSADHDTGNEVCALADLSCKETYDLGSSSSIPCGSPSHATPSFLVLCY